MKKVLSIAFVAAATMLGSQAMASDMYVTGTVGQSNIRGTGLSDHRDTAAGLGLGWQLNKNWAAELGYTHLGKFSDPGLSAKGESYQASVVGSYEVAPKVSLFGRLGVARTSLDVSGGDNYHKTTALYGVGAQYQFTPQWAGTLEVDQYHKFAGSDSKLNTVTAGLKYSF